MLSDLSIKEYQIQFSASCPLLSQLTKPPLSPRSVSCLLGEREQAAFPALNSAWASRRCRGVVAVTPQGSCSVTPLAPGPSSPPQWMKEVRGAHALRLHFPAQLTPPLATETTPAVVLPRPALTLPSFPHSRFQACGRHLPAAVCTPVQGCPAPPQSRDGEDTPAPRSTSLLISPDRKPGQHPDSASPPCSIAGEAGFTSYLAFS